MSKVLEPIVELMEGRKLPQGHEDIDFSKVENVFMINTRGQSMMTVEVLGLTIEAMTACNTATSIRLSKSKLLTFEIVY